MRKQPNGLGKISEYQKMISQIVPETVSIHDINNTISHPSHYTQGNIETIDFIRDQFNDDEFRAYCLGNTLKYISRYKYKNGVEDLQKAQQYLVWATETLIND